MQTSVIMGEIQTILSTMDRMRIALFGLACLLGILAGWILVAEALRPRAIVFTTDPQSAASIYAQRGAAVAAAQVGLLRGDLWSEAAIAYAVMLWNRDGTPAPFEETRAVTETAIAYAPHDSRLWLLLAANYFRFDWPNEKASAALKMSYYTGSNTIAVLPQRLLLSIQSRALEDDEFRGLVRHDIRIAATPKFKLIPALIAAYNQGPPSGRQFIIKTLAELDPSALALVRAQGEHR